MKQKAILHEKMKKQFHSLDYLKAAKSLEELHLNQVSRFIYSMANQKMMSNQSSKSSSADDIQKMERKKDYIKFLRNIKEKIETINPEPEMSIFDSVSTLSMVSKGLKRKKSFRSKMNKLKKVKEEDGTQDEKPEERKDEKE